MLTLLFVTLTFRTVCYTFTAHFENCTVLLHYSTQLHKSVTTLCNLCTKFRILCTSLHISKRVLKNTHCTLYVLKNAHCILYVLKSTHQVTLYNWNSTLHVRQNTLSLLHSTSQHCTTLHDATFMCSNSTY